MKKLILPLLIMILLLSCGREDPPLSPPAPGPAILVYPYMNSLCNQGTGITATESTLQFEWRAGENSDRFELNIENLESHELLTFPVTVTTHSVTLTRGMPYSWFVVSVSDESDETAQSDTWKFYLAGEVTQHYSPFPAEIVTPLMASTISAPGGVVTLDWNGSDVDDDITGYDVYFGSASPPALLQAGITETVVTDVPVVSGTIYFWRVVTEDAEGNTSDSGIYQFRVE